MEEPSQHRISGELKRYLMINLKVKIRFNNTCRVPSKQIPNCNILKLHQMILDMHHSILRGSQDRVQGKDKAQG